jgi:hypothetical protein
MWALAGRGSDVSGIAEAYFDSWQVHRRLFVELISGLWSVVSGKALFVLLL